MGGHFDPSFEITYNGHFLGACNAASMVGGANWVDQGNGTYFRDCEGLTHAPPLDLYLMGLIPSSNVPPVLKANPVPTCYEYFQSSNIVGQVTIEELQAFYGVRTPAPPNARTNFSLGFVAETYGRLLNDTEMTFYEILAREYVRRLEPSAPDVELEHGWFTITRYFDESLSSWSTEVLPLLRPAIKGVTPLPNNTVAISATGYPGKVYDLFRTTNLISWQAVGTSAATTNGTCTFTDSAGSVVFLHASTGPPCIDAQLILSQALLTVLRREGCSLGHLGG
jgi:hypothetical protein